MKSALAAFAALIAIEFGGANAQVAAAPSPAAAPADLVDRMLERLGGREKWAALTGTVNDSQQNRAGDPTVVRAVITMDFTAPRFRIETYAPDFVTVRVVDGKRSWRRTREGAVEALPADVLESDLRWYGAHVYRSIHRIARRDPALEARHGADGRLEIFENGVRMIWFKLDAQGEPYAFGAWNDDQGSICGPWAFDAVGVKHPNWVSNATGTWRAHAVSVTLNPAFTKELLARPN